MPLRFSTKSSPSVGLFSAASPYLRSITLRSTWPRRSGSPRAGRHLLGCSTRARPFTPLRPLFHEVRGFLEQANTCLAVQRLVWLFNALLGCSTRLPVIQELDMTRPFARRKEQAAWHHLLAQSVCPSSSSPPNSPNTADSSQKQSLPGSIMPGANWSLPLPTVACMAIGIAAVDFADGRFLAQARLSYSPRSTLPTVACWLKRAYRYRRFDSP